MTDLIDQAYDEAVELLNLENNKMENLPDEVVAFIRVYCAQGVIDNGGYFYFFENDWPENPPYSDFVNAYHSIGCVAQAKELKRVVETFPFESPHKNMKARNLFIEEHQNDGFLEIWGDELCGDEEVWKKLEEFYVSHKVKFAGQD